MIKLLHICIQCGKKFSLKNCQDINNSGMCVFGEEQICPPCRGSDVLFYLEVLDDPITNNIDGYF